MYSQKWTIVIFKWMNNLCAKFIFMGLVAYCENVRVNLFVYKLKFELIIFLRTFPGSGVSRNIQNRF